MPHDADDGIHVILVAWSDREDAHWRRVKQALGEAVNRVLGRETGTCSAGSCGPSRRTSPPDTRAAMRGSSVTGVNHLTGAPFDQAGPGTSDLDLTLVGEDPLSRWHEDGFYIPGVLTMPLGDEDPELAPWLEPTRRTLQRMVGRPVHIQAMSRWLLEVRRGLLGMPYLLLDA